MKLYVNFIMVRLDKSIFVIIISEVNRQRRFIILPEYYETDEFIIFNSYQSSDVKMDFHSRITFNT